MKAMILAAGRGERLRPLTDHTPKPLVSVRGKPLLQYHLEQLETAGFNELVINVCWLKEQIIQFINDYQAKHKQLNIQVIDEGQHALETGGGMLNALPLLGEQPFLAINADLFTDFTFASLPTMATDVLAHLVLVENPAHNNDGDFSFDPPKVSNPGIGQPTLTYSGIGVFHPRLFSTCQAGNVFSVTPLVRAACDEGLISGQLHQGAWNDVGSHQRLRELNAQQ
ncbi:N-acetylmuramate alpha-1-phosphate uridylyltransferase MurU [Marinicella sediminis]|uniref:N-acetylmuramate alpha-1-phosphate uridylyltransferase MurU n=1 Tax=Marinicella sediminis TaxID=1792834 RepID=A0ABV7J8J2_9GAMM|nr:nucleotidyltransferase family protein [Marinicella sediminis]